MKGIAVIDIVFLALIIIFAVRGWVRGFIGEFLSMAAVVLGLLAAFFFYRNGAVFIRERFMPTLNFIPGILAFIAIFLIVFIVVKILERLLHDIVEGIMLGTVDHFLGIVLGLAEGVIVTALVLFVFSIQPLFDPASVFQNSVFARFMLPFITGGAYNPPEIKNAALLLLINHV
jgi:membrane protein required for colicin V production